MNFLENEFKREVAGDIPLLRRQNLWIQLDGCPIHYAVPIIIIIINDHYPQRWIDGGGPISWSPRSSDIMPMGFYLWGIVKVKVYEVQINSWIVLEN